MKSNAALGRKQFARSAAAFFALAGLATAQLSSVLHVLLVEHERCALHGELVHATDRASTAHEHADATTATIDAMEGEDADAHHHCAPTWLPHGSADSIDAAVGAHCDYGNEVVCSSNAALRESHTLDVLFVAPKASPPV